MPRRWTRYGQWFIAVAVVLLTPVLVLADPSEGAKQIRVKMSLEVNGSYQHAGPKVLAPGTMYLPVKLFLDNSYSMEYVVPAETILTGAQKTNPLDPASQKEMDEYNSKVKARNDMIYHSADNLRKPNMGGSARPGGMNPGMMDMGRMQDMQKKIMACGNDQACKQRMAMEMMSQQKPQMPPGSNAQVQADIQAISDMCINEKHQPLGTKGYEDCLNAEGRSARQCRPVPPTMNRRFRSSRIAIYGEGGGQYGEGSGTNKGEGDSDPKAFQPCANAQAVFDPKTNTFWVGGLRRVEIPVVIQNAAYGRVERPDGIDEWIASILQGAPASGSKTQKFWFQTAKFTWSFVRE
jgi:hypothetical protein